MLIDITKDANLDENVFFEKEKLNDAHILDIKFLKIIGKIFKNRDGNYIINANLNGSIILPCSISLEPVEYKIDTNICGNVYEMLEELGENCKKNAKTIDILPIIWENVLMEIPIKIISDKTNVKTKGNGWELISFEKENINPALAQLNELFKEGDAEDGSTSKKDE